MYWVMKTKIQTETDLQCIEKTHEECIKTSHDTHLQTHKCKHKCTCPQNRQFIIKDSWLENWVAFKSAKKGFTRNIWFDLILPEKIHQGYHLYRSDNFRSTWSGIIEYYLCPSHRTLKIRSKANPQRPQRKG